MRNIIYVIMILIIPFIGNGQTLSEAVKFSTYDIIGTARTVGVNGAYGAMGGDYSVVMINPAGIGVYKRGEINLTPSFSNTSTSSYFTVDKSSISSRDRTQLSIDNFGYIYAGNPGGNWVNSNFVIGYNKLADYNTDYSLNGTTVGSITERFRELANGTTPNNLGEFEEGLAYRAGAIFYDEGEEIYKDDFFAEDQTQKLQIANQRGSLSEVNLGWAGNYKNKLNVGITLGIPILSYEENKNYNQSLNIAEFNNQLKYQESNTISGSGINMKLGFIYTPIKYLRLGLAVHTPSLFVLDNDYSSNIDYSYKTNNDSYEGNATSPLGEFKYNLTTPMRLTGSIGTMFTVGKVGGFLNMDYENVNYRGASYDLTSYSDASGDLQYSDELNSEINKRLAVANNIRLGGEIAIDVFRLRGGYGFHHSAYKGESELNASWALGAGFSGDRVFLDLAYRQTKNVEGYNVYYVLDDTRDPVANINTTRGRFAITVGFRI